MKYLMTAAAVVAGLALVVLTLAGVGQIRWNRASLEAVRRLHEAARVTPDGAWQAVVDQVPAPVARYFRFALAPRQRHIASARLDQQGEFLAKPGGRYSPFTAVEHFASMPPGFVWDAAIGATPLLNVRVRDGYREGHGFMVARLAGLLTVAQGRDTPELAEGALARYLAESPWLPTALLPDEGLSWEPVNDSTARATRTDGSVSASLEFHFTPDGAITRVSGLRYRDTDGQMVLTPWEGRFEDYVLVEGMRLPASGEVSWLLPEGPYTYWKGRVTGWKFVFQP